MSIINSSSGIYGASADTGIAAALNFEAAAFADFVPQVNRSRRIRTAFAADFSLIAAPRVRSKHLRQAADFQTVAAADFFVRSRSQKGFEFFTDFGFDIQPNVRLSLAAPAPIINQFPANAFRTQFYTARLLGDNIEIPISSATIESPKGAIGKRVSANVSKKQLSLIAPEKSYKFQIGTRSAISAPIVWHTVLENAALDNRSYSLAWGSNQPADVLTFGASEPLSDRLAKYPTKNLIIFDPRKTTVDLKNETPVRVDGRDEIVETSLIEKNGLSLYFVLGQLKTRLGFSAVNTNIPNYEITRVDFRFDQSWNDVLRGLLGVFEPLFYVVGSALWIIDKTAALAEDFSPRTISINQYANWNQSIEPGANIDGFVLSYVDSNSNADSYVDRTVPTTEESGSFGDPDFTETRISKTYRDSFHSDDPLTILRTDLIREIHSTYDASLNLIGREINSHVYDQQGKRTNSNRTVEAKVPDLSNGGASALLTVRRENQTVFYSDDANRRGRVFQSKTETLTSGLIAVDAENTYFDQTGAQTPFKQNFEKAHETGNLNENMTQEFGLLEKVTETLTPLGNNQFEVRISTYDYLRGKNNNTSGEPKTGDASLSATGGRQRQTVILREGLTQSSRTGLPLVPFAIGELPLIIGKPLARRMLKRKVSRKQTGSVSVIGWDESVETGVFFTAKGRNDEILGVFIVEGYQIQMNDLGAQNQKVSTTLEVSEI